MQPVMWVLSDLLEGPAVLSIIADCARQEETYIKKAIYFQRNISVLS